MRLLVGLLMPLLLAAQSPIDTIQHLIQAGRFAEAERLARAELARLEAAGQGQTEAAANVLAELAHSMWPNGKAADPETRRFAERALEIRRKLFGESHKLVARSVSDLATIARLNGNEALARSGHERAVAILEKAQPRDDLAIQQAKIELAVSMYYTGDYRAAVTTAEQALVLAERLDPDGATVAQSLNDLGVYYNTLGEYAKAKASHERALAIREKALGPVHLQVAASLNNLAGVFVNMGDLPTAIALQRRAIEIRAQVLGPEHPNVANGFGNLGGQHLRLREFAAARPLLEKSLAIRQKVLAPNHPEVAMTLSSLAVALSGLGEGERALQTALQGNEIYRRYTRANLRILSEREAQQFQGASPFSEAVVLVANGRIQDPALIRRVWDHVVRERGLLFDELAARRRSGWTLDPALTEARRQYARLLVQNRPAEFEQARLTLDRVERSLAEHSMSRRRELAREDAGAEQVAAALPAASALVSYWFFQDWWQKWSVLAFVARPDAAAPEVVPLGPAKEIEESVQAWRQALRREAESDGRAARANEAAGRQAGERLRAKIWDPVAARLSGAQRVFLVPDGVLHLVSFPALPSAGQTYLAETGPLLHVLSAEKDLAPFAETRQGQGLLIVGDTDFDLDDRKHVAQARRRGLAELGPLDPEKLVFDPLPGSRQEAAEIYAAWKKAKRGEAVLLTRAGAAEANLRQQASGKQILHLATHGFAGVTAGKEARPLGGLALAGANRRKSAASSADDGILTSEEVMTLDLEGVEWVVLSGCDTGLGQIQQGEGIFGLRRAFQLAGAATVITSLWPVEDTATRGFMRRLYAARLLQKRDTAAAMRVAMMGSLRARRAAGQSTHPFYWAGFAAVGDWR
jgi:CHAT domain-containing protein/Tfp pilus assembly protein PilF